MIKRYEELKNKIEEISESKAEKELFKSKAMWVEEGERSTRYFFNEQRSRSMNKTVRKLTLTNGIIITGKRNDVFISNQYQEQKSEIELGRK